MVMVVRHIRIKMRQQFFWAHLANEVGVLVMVVRSISDEK